MKVLCYKVANGHSFILSSFCSTTVVIGECRQCRGRPSIDCSGELLNAQSTKRDPWKTDDDIIFFHFTFLGCQNNKYRTSTLVNNVYAAPNPKALHCYNTYTRDHQRTSSREYRESDGWLWLCLVSGLFVITYYNNYIQVEWTGSVHCPHSSA